MKLARDTFYGLFTFIHPGENFSGIFYLPDLILDGKMTPKIENFYLL
jgi:hypothetical protein